MLNLPEPQNSKDLAIVISKFQQLEKGESVYLEKIEFLDLIDFYLTESYIKKAITVLDYAVYYYPTCRELKLTEAQLLVEAGLFSKASVKLKKLYSEMPDDLGLLMLIGINYAKSGIINKSTLFFDKALDSILKKEQSPVLYTISQTFIQVGRYDLASFYLSRANQITPNDDSIILDLAFCLERTEKFEKSKKLYIKYLKRNPFSKLAWYNLGVVYDKLKEFQNAIEAFDFAIAIDIKFSSAIFNKANVFIQSKKYEFAIVELDKVIELEEGNASALYIRGVANYEIGRFADALKDFKKSLKIQDNQPEAWFSLAKIYFKYNKINRTKKALFKALNIEKLNSKYWELAAKVFLFEDNYKSADKAFMHAISFNPFEDKYWFAFSDYKNKLKDVKEAISILLMGKKFISDTLLLNVKLSSLHLLNKDNKSAKLSFEEANKISPLAKTKFIKIHPNKNEISLVEFKTNTSSTSTK